VRKEYDDPTPAVTYTYDENGSIGRLTTAANGTDALHWEYDLAGQLRNEQSTRNGSVVSYGYDAAGNRISLSLDGQPQLSYGYDDASRLTSITRGTAVFGFDYDDANRRSTMTYPNGVVTNYTYDDLSRLTNLSAVHNGTTTITNFGYTYDAAGNRLTKSLPEYTESYGYDPLYRLTQVQRTGSLTGVSTYSYDAVGNRLTAQQDGSVSSSSYNEKNQLLSSTGGGRMLWRGSLDEPGNVSFTSALVNGQPARMLAGNVFEAMVQMAPGTNTVTLVATDTSGNVRTQDYQVDVTGAGATYTYDANGNLATKTEGSDNWVYTWNAENQLTKVEKNGVEVARFAYDPTGRRVERMVAGETHTYTYDVIDVLREQVSAGGETATNLYLHGNLSDQPLLRESGGTTHFYHLDGLWSVVAETDATGSLEEHYTYDAWGRASHSFPDAGFSFTSREWGPEINLYYYRARYYDPENGRFLSPDPEGTNGPNRYPYVGNNPVMRLDPFGTTWEDVRQCGRNLVTCYFTGMCKLEAERLEKQLTGGRDSDSDASNATKHCFWACCIGRAVGFKQAVLATNAHESDDRNRPEWACASEMDRWNNRMGASMGASMSWLPWDQGIERCESECKKGRGLQCSPRRVPPNNCSSSRF
jgi:RHS repeat-associated protein